MEELGERLPQALKYPASMVVDSYQLVFILIFGSLEHIRRKVKFHGCDLFKAEEMFPSRSLVPE